MTKYIPQLINDTDEVRNAFTPRLSIDDISENELLIKIEMVEMYIAMKYFSGNMPSKDIGRIPALLIVMTKVIKQSNLIRKYGIPNKIHLEQYEITIPYSGNVWEDVKSWEQMAHEILKERISNRYFMRKVNDK